MTHARTIRLADATGKTLQAACLEDRRVALLWTDATITILYAQLGYDGDGPEMEDDYQSSIDCLTDKSLEALGLLTQEERIERFKEQKRGAELSTLNYEQREYARLKQKFEGKP